MPITDPTQQPQPPGMGNEPPQMGGDVFEYKPAYGYAAPYTPMTNTAMQTQLDPIMREHDRRSGVMADEFKAGQTMRGIRNSTPGFNQALDFNQALQDQRANTYMGASNALQSINRANQAQGYNQQMGGRGQNFSEFMQMYGAQNANDASRQQQGSQAIQALLAALSGSAGAPAFGTGAAQPGALESFGTLLSNFLPYLMMK